MPQMLSDSMTAPYRILFALNCDSCDESRRNDNDNVSPLKVLKYVQNKKISVLVVTFAILGGPV